MHKKTELVQNFMENRHVHNHLERFLTQLTVIQKKMETKYINKMRKYLKKWLTNVAYGLKSKNVEWTLPLSTLELSHKVYMYSVR